ncbi:MAG: trehalose-6-phosphate synthase, partial [Dehalococcoidia bacterium]
MPRVILVSNRLPVTLRQDPDGTQHVEPSSGGLVAGLQPLHEQSGSLWIGHPGTWPERDAGEELERQRLIPVAVPDEDYGAYYDGYSNTAVWPLFHYLLERCDFDPEQYAAYRRVNERFAETVLGHARPDDLIWIHDYQLMLLPQLIRRHLPDARIGFFLHIPFPSSEVFRVLPEREEILRGLLGADLIGVHTYEYADHLARSIRRVLGFEHHSGLIRVGARDVHIEPHPMGIDVDGFRERAFSPEADQLLATHREWVHGRQVILGVDRLDYTKGLPLKLEAFRLLLQRSPRWRDDAVFIQLAVPSREGIEGYQEQRAEVE